MDKDIEAYVWQIVSELECDNHEKSEIAEEMTSHLMSLKEEYISQGISPDEAVKRALQTFGNDEIIKEGMQQTLFPYYKTFKVVNWVLFGVYALVLLSSVLFLRILLRIINPNNISNPYFFISPGKSFWSMDTWLENSNIIPFHSILEYITGSGHYNFDIIVSNTIGSILLFVPLGMFLPILFRKCASFKGVLATAILVSTTIEIMQYFLQMGRLDIDDIILSVIGSSIGYFFLRMLMKAPLLSKWNVFHQSAEPQTTRKSSNERMSQMKKTALWSSLAVLLLFAPLLLSAQTKKEASPEEFVEHYLALGMSNDYQSIVDLIVDDRFTYDAKRKKMDTYKMLQEGLPALKKYDIKEVKGMTDEKATVLTVLKFEDGSVQQTPMHLVKMNEQWKLQLGSGDATADEDFKLVKGPDAVD